MGFLISIIDFREERGENMTKLGIKGDEKPRLKPWRW